MRILLSTIGSRGDVAPLIAMARRFQDGGHDAHLCAPPNFADLAAGFDLSFTAVGHDLRQGPRRIPGGPATTVLEQFRALGPAATDCDVIVGCAAMQLAARSIAEKLGVPYFYATYAPVALPSAHHPPPPVAGPPRPDRGTNNEKWELDARWWNDVWAAGLTAARARIGLAPVADVRSHVFTDRPLLAADPTLAPWPTPSDLNVVQTGAWLMSDDRPLPADVERFLDAGDPPVLFSFGSIRTPRASAADLLASARAAGLRALLMHGWADLRVSDDGTDWRPLGETNLQALLPRLAAIVHHGGAGTTTESMWAGTPQLVLPHEYDQPYYAGRVAALGIGAAHPDTAVTAESLAAGLGVVLSDEVRTRARAMASAVRTDGTAVAMSTILRR
jgi:vancomycin aglycone glucosyltransferase